MNQKRLMKTKWFRGIALVLAIILALPTALANIGKINAAAAEEAVPTRYGDIDGDGEVTASDALEALRSAAKLTELSEAQILFGNVDGEGALTAADALLILQYAAKLITKFPVEEPKPTEEVTPAPARNTAPPQTFDEKNVTPGEKLVPTNLNGAVYDKQNDIYVFSSSTEGMEVPNPIAENPAFEEDYGYLRTAQAADGKENPWDLEGSVLGWNADDGKTPGLEHADSDKRIYNAPLENEVDYSIIPQETAPEGGHAGYSISFWLQTQKDDENAPLLVIGDRNYTTIVTVNGSVNYGTATLQLDALQNSNYSFIAKKGEWHYYTVTFANDWITFYMDGYEVPFEVTNIGRGKIGYFNDGFLTRYNTGLTWTEDDYANHDWQGYLEQQRGSHKDYKSITNDEYTVFGNTRFRGTHRSESTGAKLLLTRMTSKNTKVYIGGATTEVLTRQAKHALTPGTLVSGLTCNLTELNAAQVFANYTKAAENMPGTTTVTPAPDQGEVEATPLPEVNLTDGRPFNVKDAANADVTTDSKGLERYTFKAIDDPEEAYGVEFENLFDNTEEKEKVRETIDSALETWKKENNADLFPTGVRAAEADSNHTYYHNYFDVYHGDVSENPLRLDDEGKNDPDDPNIPHTTFHRPVWTKGASIGFWFKPSQAVIDSSNTDTPIPIMTMYATNKFAFEMEADGSLAFVDLNNAAWDGDRRLQANQWCHNSFMTKGDPSKVTADEWNYYTITFANDWIQVYINGEEVVYKVSGLRRKGMKDFNGGFMSKYNPVGLMLEGDDDPHDYIKNNGNGTDKYGNYGGITLKMQTYDEYAATNEKTDNDDASIRATGVYVNGYYAQKEVEEDDYQYTLLLDALTTSGAKFYMGGVQTGLNKALGWGIEGSATKRIRYTDHLVPEGIQFADVRFFEDDLTAAQAEEAYEKAKARLGEETGEEPGPQPGGDTEEADYVANRHKSATYSNGIYTFTAPVKEDELTYKVPDRYGEGLEEKKVDQAFGVELKNPFVQNADALKETVTDAFAGQTMVYPDNPDANVAAAAAESAVLGDGLLLAGGNSGDSYNNVKYQKPKWNKGATMSFWYKPADLSDRSPILFMCGDSDKGGAFGLLSDGSVIFASLKYADWAQRQAIGANHCFNCFTALGDGEETQYVKEGQWNYYTVTLANDWIQVYVNGEEVIYKYVNLGGDRTGQDKFNLKFFNAGYMTRYNTIGQPTEADDTKGYFKACGGLPENGVDNFLCSIRANTKPYRFVHAVDENNGVVTAENGYQAEIPSVPTRYAEWSNEKGDNDNTLQITDPKLCSVKGSLMMDLLTDESMKLYIGGAPSQLSSDGNPSVIKEGTAKGGTGWNAHAYDSEKELGAANGREHYPKQGEANAIPVPAFWFDSKHNQEGSSFADFDFVADELDATEVKAAYDALTVDPEGNALTAE